MSSDDTYFHVIRSPWSLTKVISVAIRNLYNVKNVTTEMVTVCLLKNVEGSYEERQHFFVYMTKDTPKTGFWESPTNGKRCSLPSTMSMYYATFVIFYVDDTDSFFEDVLKFSLVIIRVLV
jgi:hypothetical protein